MKLKLTKSDVYSRIILHSNRLTTAKKKFVMNVLDKHTVSDALYALYIVLYVAKSEEQLLSYRF